MPAYPKPVTTKRKKKQSKSERKILEARLDSLVSAIVIMRDKKCVTCGTSDGLTCSHFVQRRKMKLRWDLTNCNCQCSVCNGKHNRYPESYTAWMLRRYGQETVLGLLEAGQINAWKWSVLELRGFDAWLTVEYNRLLALASPEMREWAIRRVR